jgi:hypothetical protein
VKLKEAYRPIGEGARLIRAVVPPSIYTRVPFVSRGKFNSILHSLSLSGKRASLELINLPPGAMLLIFAHALKVRDGEGSHQIGVYERRRDIARSRDHPLP